MVFGADVFHPGREEKGQPSVAAVCASMDKSVTRYVGRCSMNRRIRNETIEGLEGMAIDLLKLFQRRNSVLPFQIVFYRDGVAEGQFEHVLNEEVKALKRAFDRVYGEKDQKYLLSCKNVVMHGKKISYKAFMISFFFIIPYYTLCINITTGLCPLRKMTPIEVVIVNLERLWTPELWYLKNLIFVSNILHHYYMLT